MKYPLLGISKELYRHLNENLGGPIYPLEKGVDILSLEKNNIQDLDWRSLYFKLFWLSKVNESLHSWHHLNTDDIWIAADVFLNLGKMSTFSEAYDIAASRMPKNDQLQKNVEFYRKMIRFNEMEWLLK